MNRLSRALVTLPLIAVLTLLGIPGAVSGIAATTPTVQVFRQHAKAFFTGTAPDSDTQAVANELKSLFALANTSGWTIDIDLFGINTTNSTDHGVVDQVLDSLSGSSATVNVVLDSADAPFGPPGPPAGTQVSGCPKVPGEGTSDQWDQGSYTHAAARLLCISHASGGSFVRCDGGCLVHNGGIDHNKFVLLRGPNGQRIVASSSANWTPTQLQDEYQNMTVIQNDSALYDSFEAYFEAERADSGNDNPPSTPNYGDDHYFSDDTTSVFYFPRQGTNPLLTALQKVDCSQHPNGFVGSVRIDTNLYTDPDTVAQLNTMANAGCSVKVLTSTNGRSSSLTFNSKIQVACVANQHRKDMIVNAYYGANQPDNNVFTGSKPFARQGSVTDNVMLRLQGYSTYVQPFADDYDQVFAKAGTTGCTA